MSALDKLDVYIAQCDAVVHLIGNMTGSAPEELALRTLRKKYPDLTDKLPPLGEACKAVSAFLHAMGGLARALS
jgi:hypothetical protein